ncbi:hypothetical protein DFP72DRAFT_1164714 [Ephemerocybe angulata]|uniref:Uncharacterized protein n=1 Tax=Ephemerocybe angulata TaxID=980116 RepID=A0A8H6IEK9_9AGAR|nr:hypothetical protein DFP72DRAFT_1164714 [Tulosesus angulatus]
MPRLAARLVKAVQDSKGKGPFLPFPKHKPRKSLHDPFQPLESPSFNFRNHERSILLHDPECNPITHSRAYEYHKSLPPIVNLPKGAKAIQEEKDKPREMSKNERQWWSSPYLRMLSSPLRRCSITDQYLPSDFLVRFSYLRLPPSVGSGQSLAIVPDGMQHSKYTSRKGGHSVYTQCLREAVDQLYRKAPFKRATKDSTVVANAKLGDQVLHLLRLRVLQELERLAVHMQYTIIRDDVEDPGPIIRRLTADEFSAIENSGTIPYQNALAIVVVPPLEKDPVTGEFPRASMSPMPFSEGTDSSPPLGITLPPLSVLLPASADARSCSEGPHVRGLLPKLAVPLYNALPAFPFAPQRAALQDLLARATVVEQKRDRRQRES